MGCAKSKEAQAEQPYKKHRSFNLRSHSSPFRRSSNRRKRDTTNDNNNNNSLRLSNAQRVSVASSPISTAKNKNSDEQERKKIRNGSPTQNHIQQQRVSAGAMATQEEIPSPCSRTPPMHEEVPSQCSSSARTPPREAETINTWELMEGLEDNTPPRRNPNTNPNPIPIPAEDFSFHVITDTAPIKRYTPTIEEKEEKEEDQEYDETKPVWLQKSRNNSASNAGSIVSDFDPEIISTFRKALDELSPKNAALLRSPGSERVASPGDHRLYSNNSMDFPSPCHSRMFSKDSFDSRELENVISVVKSSPIRENVVVLYFTSLRGVRKTYEDCCNVRVILKGLGVKVDERDVSMHYGFREELRQLLGTEGLLGKLPRVFVKGKYIGTAEDVRRMHENGQLEAAIQGCEMVDESANAACEACGDIRFVPCEMCSGSCKIYIEEKEHDEEVVVHEENIGGFQRCPYCNENGIVRCPICCSYPRAQENF